MFPCFHVVPSLTLIVGGVLSSFFAVASASTLNASPFARACAFTFVLSATLVAGIVTSPLFELIVIEESEEESLETLHIEVPSFLLAVIVLFVFLSSV